MIDAELMPAAVEAEKTILGAILNECDRLEEIAAILNPDDFSLESHRRIFSAMLAGKKRDGSVDLVTLCQELVDRKEIESVGGHGYVTDLTSGIPHHSVIDNYIKIVKEKARYRAILAVSSGLSARAYSQDEPSLEIVSWGISEISAIAESGITKLDVYEAADLLEGAEYQLLDNPPDSPALPTGIESLDIFTNGGIRLGELWIIGASPSRGKTTLARQIGQHTVCRKVPAYVHSGEMTKESWFEITACLIEGVETRLLRNPRLLTNAEKERIRCGLHTLGQLPFSISDEGGIHIDRLIWNATRKVKRDGIKLLAVDYAQIIRAEGRDERQKVTEVAQKLRVFAKDQNVAVLLLSQSPRPEGRGINTRPTMYSLKESGALEEAAHAVILPYRPVDTATNAFTGEDELIIAKQRAGAIGSIPVHLNGQYLRFEERQCARQ